MRLPDDMSWARAMSRAAASTAADRELVDRLIRRDGSAMSEIYTTYGRRLLAYAARVHGDADAAEDIVQDSLIAAWHAPRSYRGDGSLLAWLLGIVRNQALNARRRQRPAGGDLDVVGELASTEATPLAQVEAGQRASDLHAGLAALTPDHRETLELVFFHGLTLAEVAEVSGCPVGTVKSRLHHAKLRLRTALAEGRLEQEPR